MMKLTYLLFEAITPDQIHGNNYIAVELDEESTNLLLSEFQLPEGWKPAANHITLVPPPAIGGFKKILEGSPLDPKKDKQWFALGGDPKECINRINSIVGQTIRIEVIAVGQSDKTIAAKVNIPELQGMPSLNKFRHVTIGISPTGTAKDSNDIQEFTPASMNIQGTVRLL